MSEERNDQDIRAQDGEQGQRTVVVVQSQSELMGILCIAFGIVAFIHLDGALHTILYGALPHAIVFGPLGILFGIIALFRGEQEVRLWFVGILLSASAMWLSPPVRMFLENVSR